MPLLRAERSRARFTALAPSATAGVLAAAMLFPAIASAAPERVSDGFLIGAGSDGRYLQVVRASETPGFEEEGIMDSTTGEFTAVTDLIEDVADRSPTVLLYTGQAIVRDLATGAEERVDVDVNGERISWNHGLLVRDGRGVIFEAGVPGFDGPVIFERDLDTGVTTERLRGATLLSASEDGRVITWQRTVLGGAPPAGIQPHPDAPEEAPAGLAAGYHVRGDAPRVVATPSWTQKLAEGEGKCEDRQLLQGQTMPYGLEVQQDGVGGGRYLLALQWREYSPGYPIPTGGVDRIDAEGRTPLGTSTFTQNDAVTLDPVSSAWAKSVHRHGQTLWTEAQVTDDRGQTWEVELPAEEGTTTPATGVKERIVPINRGAGAIFRGDPRPGQMGDTPSGTYAETGRPAVDGTSTAKWLALPRSSDAADGPSVKVAAEWVDCTPEEEPAAPRGVFADYVQITVKPRGNASAAVSVNLKPSGKEPATSAVFRMSWLGLPFATRTVTRSQALALPSIIPWLPGYRVDTRVNFPSGALNRSVTLFRNG